MVYDIREYGAAENGTLCTEEIQAAIDAAFLAGGGEVTVPEGRFLTGGLRFRTAFRAHPRRRARKRSTVRNLQELHLLGTRGCGA